MNRRSTALLKRQEQELPTYEVGFQSWTEENLLVESNHEGVIYYTTRWDALCPYINVSEEMLSQVRKPFIIYALPPDGPFGVPIRDYYGMADTQSDEFWNDERLKRKFVEYEKLFRHYRVEKSVIYGKSLTLSAMQVLGGEHFEKCEIGQQEIEGFLDYVKDLDVLLIQAFDQDGTLILTDMSILLPDYDQVYGSFCQWNSKYKNRSPGIYACLAACQWAAENGYRYYNMGPVNDYEYKSLFVTDYEPIYSMVLTDLDHPLALDKSSPLYTDFRKRDWNRVYRKIPRAKTKAESKKKDPAIKIVDR